MTLLSQQPVLCVDFGLDRLSVLEVTGGRISGWSVRDLPSHVVRNGDPVEPGQLARLLKEAITESGLSGVRARFTLPDEAAIFRLVELPAMPRRHIQRALGYMVDKDVPLPLESIRWDWDILARTDIGYRICLVAAWRDVIERIGRVAAEAGLQLEVVEPRSLAMARALDRDRVVVFDASSQRLQTLYLKRGAIPFVEQAPVGRDEETTARTLERLLRRGRSAEDEGAPDETFVLGGHLEDVDLPLSVSAVPVSRVLIGQARQQPPGMPSGSLLANLGMADQVMRGFHANRLGIASVNLLGWTGPQQLRRRLNRLQVDFAHGTSTTPVDDGAATADWFGRVKPRLAGSEVQSD